VAISWNEAVAQWQRVVLLLDEFEKQAASNTGNFVDLQQGLTDILRGESADQITATMERWRSSISSFLSPEFVQQILTPIFADLMIAIDAPNRGFALNARSLRDYMVEQGESVKARALTQNAASAAMGNAGDGDVFRLLLDQDDFPLQGCYAEAVNLVCVRDQATVEIFNEVFEYRGEPMAKDFARLNGSGLRQRIVSASVKQASRFLSNPSFDTFSGTQPTPSNDVTPSAITSVTNWVLSSTAAFRMTADNTFRGALGVSAPLALKFHTDGTVSQVLRANTNPRIPPPDDNRIPYLLAPGLTRLADADGNLVMRLGETTRTIAINSLTTNVKTRSRLNLDKGLYYANWKKLDAVVSFQVASKTTGTLVIDDVMLIPFVLINGLWFAVIGGPDPNLFGDSFSFTDSESGRAKMQYWTTFRSGLSGLLRWAFTLPSDALGYETISDPVAS
jgi:hypothetical protein